jgi:hypothetical protein
MTIYWFSSTDEVRVDNPWVDNHWVADVIGIVVVDVILGLGVFAILYSGRHVRRQAKGSARVR